MSRTSDSESSDSDHGIQSKTDRTRYMNRGGSKHSSGRERSESPRRSGHKEKSRHKSKKHGKKRHCSSDDESSRSKKRKHKDKTERKEKKKSKKKKQKKEKKVETSDSESTDNSLEVDVGKREGKLQVSTQQISEDRVIGPEMPDHLLNNQSDTSKESDMIGPMLPSNLRNSTSDASEHNEDKHSIGPMLPPHPKQATPGSSKEIIGPIWPSHSGHQEMQQLSEKVIGPILPPYLRDKLIGSEELSTIGPSLPSSETFPTESTHDGSDDEETYGPLPAGAALSKAHIELEERALQMQIDKLDPKGQDEPSREEWMTELPAAKAANFGLGPRQFRTKAGPDLSDRSSWTDTPQDKANKKNKKTEPQVDYKREAELSALRNRDKEQEALTKKMKRNEESLVEMHNKKMKNKEDSGPKERRPFSRDIDLQVNRFDEAQKKAVLKKAQLLDSRFSSGESKYL